MDTQAIISELETERDRLETAIAALHGRKRGPGKPSTNGRKRRLSASGRKRISEAQKKRWAAIKKK
jgi:hypothetical protein